MIPQKYLVGKTIAIQLIDGTKIFGTVAKWSQKLIWVKEGKNCVPKDIPKDIIVRALILFKGDLDGDE